MRLQEDLGLIVVNLCGILKVTILRFKMCQASLRAFDTQEEIPCCLRGHTLITLACFCQFLTLVSIFTTVPDNSYSTVVSILQTK